MDMLTDHFLVEVGGFLGGLEGLVLLSIIGEIDREVVEGSGEAVGVSGWVVLGQGPVEVGGCSCGLEGLVQ